MLFADADAVVTNVIQVDAKAALSVAGALAGGLWTAIKVYTSYLTKKDDKFLAALNETHKDAKSEREDNKKMVDDLFAMQKETLLAMAASAKASDGVRDQMVELISKAGQGCLIQQNPDLWRQLGVKPPMREIIKRGPEVRP